jgi:predicted nucleic acid-binding protein
MFLDACVIIYLLEGTDEKSDKVRQLVAEYLTIEENYIFISSLSILECLVFPKKLENFVLISEYESFFAADNVMMIDISRDVVYLGLELRTKYNIRTPDALQLACAMKQQAKFMTADKDLFKVTEVEIISV